ncbi:uncharacterized protein MELLADRAFT_61885 [Melampsora larici-populina 98AG31]|uniref:C3H1-type domain-containing protein n=1 Tax=Melampsora larici-populina (strain 98AG31 / pathotype 3-4-7) TaxID=747676 RepID=F4RGP3_MELLP|nr:uncharacterized protein MELLADRAFT_61885 [Melampsora larici-populina 98AG31]EGG08590.1 hypothetical protein MELLADRAFT_61885 [Melampsora larici-populina 98AG31]
MVGSNYVWPKSMKALFQSDPAVLMPACPFRRPAEGSFIFSVDDHLLADISKASSAARHAADPGPSSLHRKGTERSRSPRRQSRRGSPSRRRKSRSPTRRRFDSVPRHQPSRRSPERSRRRSRSPGRSRRRSKSPDRRRFSPTPPRRQRAEDQPRHSNYENVASPRQRDTSQGFDNRRTRFDNSPERPREPPLLNRIDSSIFNRINTDRMPIVDKGKRHRVSSSPEHGSTSNVEKVFKKFVASANKAPKKLAFQTVESSEHDQHTDPLVREIKRIKAEYKEDIKRAADLFEACSAKPNQWPSSQSRDLLEYKYVDLEKVYAELYGKPGAIKTIKINESKDLEFDEKIKGVPIQDKTHWLHLIDILDNAYCTAFAPALHKIKDYFKYIIEFVSDPSTGIHWKDVRDFDSALRLQFSRQTNIPFGDFSNPKLKYLESKILYGRFSRLGNGAEVIKDQPLHTKSSTSKTSTTSYQKPKPKPAPKKTKSRIDFPYEIKDSASWRLSDTPCNNWNTSMCKKSDDECSRRHNLCNKVGCDADHRGRIAHA